MILIDYAFRIGKNYYPQVFLEECKYIVKEKKITKYTIDDMTLLEKILMKKIKKYFSITFFSIDKYYQKHKERLRKEAREKYQNLSEEKKGKRRKKVRDRNQNPFWRTKADTTWVYEKILFST